jgi:hypothetical protein
MATLPDEAEALQTDVMRFLAIICMCLMIVFSLVKSMPVSSHQNKPKMHEADMQVQEVAVLKETAQQLSQEIERLERETARRKQTLEEMTASLEKTKENLTQLSEQRKQQEQEIADKTQTLATVKTLLSQARQRTVEFQDKADAAKKELEKKRADIATTQTLIAASRTRLQEAKESVQEAKEKLRQTAERKERERIEAQLEAARKAAEKQRIEAINRERQRAAKEQAELAEKAQRQEQTRKERLEALKQQAREQAEALRQQQLEREKAQQQARENAAKQKASESASQSSQKRGFSLSFASNSALERLLQIPGGISLYLVAGGKSWRLDPGAGLYRFESAASPGQIYDMDLRTVPDKILRAGRKVVAAFGAGQARYGVKLTPSMQNRIAQLMTEHSSGDLIIAQSGDISIEE